VKDVYEHMKALSGELQFSVGFTHGRDMHPGPLTHCRIDGCVHKLKLIKWAEHLENKYENPNYLHSNATYEEITNTIGR
jgi:hypothetical protein